MRQLSSYDALIAAGGQQLHRARRVNGVEPASISLQVLMIEDNPADFHLVRESLRDAWPGSFELISATCLRDGLRYLAVGHHDVVLLDLRLPDGEGLETFQCIHHAVPQVPVVILTSLGDERIALDAMRHGAQDYLIKEEADGKLVGRALRYAVERRRADDALAESEQRFWRVFQDAAVGMALLDSRGCYLDCNGAFHQMLAYGRGELAGKHFREVTLADDVPEQLRLHGELVAGRCDQARLEKRFNHKDGRSVWGFATYSAVRDPCGGLVHVIEVVQDLTERKGLERTVSDLSTEQQRAHRMEPARRAGPTPDRRDHDCRRAAMETELRPLAPCRRRRGVRLAVGRSQGPVAPSGQGSAPGGRRLRRAHECRARPRDHYAGAFSDPLRCGLAEVISRVPEWEVCGEAATPVEAMSELRRTSPDLMIVDIRLDGASGLDLIKQVTEDGYDVKILVSSMLDDVIYAGRALRAGALGYVNKQESPETVRTAIHTVLSGEIFLNPRTAAQLLHQAVGHGQAARASIESLSDRELDVFLEIGHGHTTQQIAHKLCVGMKSVETYRERIKTKLKLKNGSELTRFAMQWVLDHA